MTNRDFLKQVSADGLPDASTVLDHAQKPSGVKRRFTVLVVAATMLVGIVGTAYAKSSSEAAEMAQVVAEVANSIKESTDACHSIVFITIINPNPENGNVVFRDISFS